MNYQVGGIEFGLLVLIKILIQDKRNKIFLEQMLELKERFLLKDLLKTLVATLVLIKVLQKSPIM